MSMVDVLSRVVFEGIQDPLTKQDYEDTDDFDFWEDDERDFFQQDGNFDKLKHLDVGEEGVVAPLSTGAQRVSVGGWTQTGEPSGQTVVNPDRWMKKYENGRIPLEAMVPVAGNYLRPDVASAFKAMARDAKKDGVDLKGAINYGYRDFQLQAQLYAELNPQGLPVAAPGASNHGWGTAVDMSSGPARTWMEEHAGKYGFSQLAGDPPHFDFNGEYKAPVNAHGQKRMSRARKLDKAAGVKAAGNVAKRPTFTSINALPGGIGLLAVLDPDLPPPPKPRKGKGGKAPQGGVKKQLWQGFIDAGRPDLAAMVRTEDFDTWIGAESGWVVDKTSPANNQGMANDGLFQVWRGHSYNANGQVSKMNAYQQARLVARFFPHLEPKDIRTYADQVRNGSYIGWG